MRRRTRQRSAGAAAFLSKASAGDELVPVVRVLMARKPDTPA
jgi:hypothetical protein